MSWLTSALRSSWADRLCFVEAGLLLGASRAAVAVLPFRWIAPLVGQQGAPAATPREEQLAEVKRVRIAVDRAIRHVPFGAACLAQAITGKLMLNRRGIPSTMYLGVNKQGPALRAHA